MLHLYVKIWHIDSKRQAINAYNANLVKFILAFFVTVFFFFQNKTWMVEPPAVRFVASQIAVAIFFAAQDWQANRQARQLP